MIETGEPLLEVKNLTVYYENAIANNNITILCRDQKITGVFGPNSAGKTTLMSAISGIITYYKKQEEMRGGERISWYGQIGFDGEEIVNLDPSERARRGIILCPERRRIFPESTVLENLKIGGHLATKIEARNTLNYVFQIFPQLSRLKRKQGGFLSGGEQQMLAIGRALMAQPRLLLLDEPLLGLAPLLEVRLVKAFREINQELGLSLLISEQYARPVLPVVDYCYVLKNGSVVFEGFQGDFVGNPDVMNAYFGGMLGSHSVRQGIVHE